MSILQDDAEFLYHSDARVRANMRELRRLGVDWLRLTAPWSNIAPGPALRSDPTSTRRTRVPTPRAPGAVWTGRSRTPMTKAVKVMIDIGFWAPRWAVENPTGSGRERSGVKPDDFADFAEAVATRYKQATAFGIWNEPNYRVFLMPQHERRDGRWVRASPHSTAPCSTRRRRASAGPRRMR